MQSSRHRDDDRPGPSRGAATSTSTTGSLLGRSMTTDEMKEANIDAQIAALLAQKSAMQEEKDRKSRENKVLVGGSPSPSAFPLSLSSDDSD